LITNCSGFLILTSTTLFHVSFENAIEEVEGKGQKEEGRGSNNTQRGNLADNRPLQKLNFSIGSTKVLGSFLEMSNKLFTPLIKEVEKMQRIRVATVNKLKT
jgi:hypothetical protein